MCGKKKARAATAIMQPKTFGENSQLLLQNTRNTDEALTELSESATQSVIDAIK